MIEAQTTSDSIPIIPAGPQSVGQRPVEIPQNLAVCRAAGLAATSCSCPRPVLPINISVPAHAARHYGEFASGKPDSGADASVASRVVTSVIVDHRQASSVMSPRIEACRPPGISFSRPPKPRRKRAGRVCRSPVSLLGIGGVVRRPPMADWHAGDVHFLTLAQLGQRYRRYRLTSQSQLSHSAIRRSRHWPCLSPCLCIPSHV